jgi:hypothetical protein
LLIIVGDAERMLCSLCFNLCCRKEGRKKKEEKSINSLPFPFGLFDFEEKEETFDFVFIEGLRKCVEVKG